MKSWSPLSAIWQWIRDNNNTLDDLQRCAEGEIERIAGDNGLSVSEFRTPPFAVPKGQLRSDQASP
jgi:hypothetical protein